MPTEKEKMLSGETYIPWDEELTADRDRAEVLQNELNEAKTREAQKKAAQRLFGHFGKNSHLRPNFRCDYGYNIFIGDDVDINYDCTFLDVGKVTIGDRTLFGPGVHIYSVNHPLDPEERRKAPVEYGKNVNIGHDVWIGGRVTICPGVSIGNGVTVGAGSLVTKDVPDNVLVVGSPAKIVKSFNKKE